MWQQLVFNHCQNSYFDINSGKLWGVQTGSNSDDVDQQAVENYSDRIDEGEEDKVDIDEGECQNQWCRSLGGERWANRWKVSWNEASLETTERQCWLSLSECLNKVYSCWTCILFNLTLFPSSFVTVSEEHHNLHGMVVNTLTNLFM